MCKLANPFVPYRAGRVCSTVLALSADGRTVASGGDDGTARVWDAQTGELLRIFSEGHYGQVSSVALSADGRTLLSGGADGFACVLDVRSGRSLCTLVAGEGTVTASH